MKPQAVRQPKVRMTLDEYLALGQSKPSPWVNVVFWVVLLVLLTVAVVVLQRA